MVIQQFTRIYMEKGWNKNLPIEILLQVFYRCMPLRERILHTRKYVLMEHVHIRKIVEKNIIKIEVLIHLGYSIGKNTNGFVTI